MLARADSTLGPRWRLEVVGRLALVVLCVAVLPDIFWADAHAYWRELRETALDHLPYRDFVWSFPPVTLVVTPAAVVLRDSPGAFTAVLGTAMALCEYASLVVLRRAWPGAEPGLTRWWCAVVVPLSAVAWFRFDHLAVLFAVLAMAAWRRGRPAATALTLGLLAKLWPVVLLVAFAGRRRWDEVGRTLAYAAVSLSAWWVVAPAGIGAFVDHRRGSGFNVESVVGSLGLLAGSTPRFSYGTWVVEPGWSAGLDKVLLAGWLVLAAWTLRRALRGRGDPLLLAGGLVVALLLASRLLSPQFLVWAGPFVALARARGDRAGRIAGACFASAAVLTLAVLFVYAELLAGAVPALLLVVARNALLGAVAVHLLGAKNSRSYPEGADRLRGWSTPSSFVAPASTISATSASSCPVTA